RSFLRTGRALIDVYGKEITLRVNDEAVTFNLNQTTRYSYTYDDLSVNRIDIIDVAREEYAQEILGFSSYFSGGSPTSTFEPILFDSSPPLTPFKGSDFILEEIEAYLKDDSISSEINHAYSDPEGDICLIEKLLNNDPLQLPLMDLKEVIKAKSSIEEPPEVELKDLPSHLEYAYLEENDKLQLIILKDLKDEEKEALFNVLKSHKRAIAWKITDCLENHRHQGPWVSPIHYVPKKGGITVVANEENELIPTRLVTGWRVRIDYRKLNEATRIDNFPLPFMDQIEGIVLGHKISKSELEVDHAKVDVITKLPHPTTMKGVRSFLGHVGFYRRFIQDFSKIARPMTHLLEKETLFVFSKDCIDAFETLKKKLTEALILIVSDWNLPFELMCDASDFAIGAVLGQWMSSQQKKKFFKDTSGQVEVSNCGLKHILEKTVGENCSSWNGYCKNHEKRTKNRAITDTRMERNDTLAIRVKLDFDPRVEIYGKGSKIDQMIAIKGWGILSRNKHTPKGYNLSITPINSGISSQNMS
nr:reverse transcriptase domain-containing protein [Tanacetum cinerariifolium]